MHPLNPIAPPIAMLHSVSNAVDDSLALWCISQKAFLLFLDTIEYQGCQTTHFAEILDAATVPFRRQVILSFDDCAKHLLDFAVPELLRRNMKAVFYMPTAYTGGYNEWDVEKGGAKLELMNKSDLKELVSLGMEVGSHSHSHIALKNLTDKQQREEVTRSKQLLEEITGRAVSSFAYPYGSVPHNYKTLLADAGYHYGVSIYQPFQTALALRRFGVYEKDSAVTLIRKLSQPYRWMRSVYDAIKKN